MQNQIAAAVVNSVCDEHDETRPIRILEVGAGTGATSAAILPGLPRNARYCFTDVSRFFLKRAARQFVGFGHLQYALFDIDRPPAEQGLEGQSFDVIVGANALHTAQYLDRTLQYLQSLLAPFGVLIAVETTVNTALQMITFGHFEGVNHFQDYRLKLNRPFVSAAGWLSMLRNAGFPDAGAVPDADATPFGWTQHVIVGIKGA